MTRFLSTCLAALFIGGPSLAEAGRWQRTKLQVPGTILWSGAGDLDADGWRDLVVSYRRNAGPASRKFIGVFFGSEGGFPPRPTTAFAAPKIAAAFDIGDVAGDPAEELVYLSRDGVWAQSLKKRRAARPTRVLAVPTLAAGGEQEDLVSWDFVRAPTAGEPLTMIVPGRNGLLLYRRAGPRWTRWSTINTGYDSFYDAERSTYRRSRRGGNTGRNYAFSVTTVVPNLTFADQTGDGRVDLITNLHDRVMVFSARPDGTLTSTPTFQRWFKIRTRQELVSRDTDLDVQFADLDHDGVADLSVTKIGGGLTNMKTETRLYRGRKGGGFSRRPDQTFRDDGFASLVRYMDVDGDGRLEMVHPRASVSIIGLTRVLLSSELKLDFRIREGDRSGGGLFATKPADTFTSALGLDFTVGGALRGAYPVLGSDLDGDRRPDVAVTQGKERLAVHTGLPPGPTQRIFSEDPRYSITIDATRHTRLIHLGRGAPPALLMLYVGRPALQGQMVLLSYKD